jgi:predicted alpha/beta-fold hydrolase
LDLRRIETPDGDELELRSINAPDGAPQLLLLHGLEGSLRSHYVASTLSSFAASGWGAHFLSFRSCGERMNRTRRFYHSGDTADLSLALDSLVGRFPSSPICVAGVSLGGNLLLKYLGERGETVPRNLKGAAAISVPFDLARSAVRISSGFSRVYQRFFMRTLKEKVLEKRARFPDLPDAGLVRGIRTLEQFDDLVTAPLHGFASAADYYEKSSSIRFLGGIRVPTLLLSAVDDPFLPPEALAQVKRTAEQNPALHIEFPARGGHVGFVTGADPWHARYYAEERVLDFFNSIMGAEQFSTGRG